MAEVKPTNGTWQDVRVSLGPDAEVTGKLSFATPTRIEGKLKGELRASDLLIIGPQAIVQANVRDASQTETLAERIVEETLTPVVYDGPAKGATRAEWRLKTSPTAVSVFRPMKTL